MKKDLYKNGMSRLNVLIILGIIVVVVIAAIIFWPQSDKQEGGVLSSHGIAESGESEEVVYGNTSGNLACGGYAVQDDEWIYYSNYNDHFYLYKMRHDGSKNQLVNEDSILNLSIANGWLYYYNTNGISKIRTNGKDFQQLSSDYTASDLTYSYNLASPYIVGEWLYYVQCETSGNLLVGEEPIRTYSIWRMLLDGSSSQMLSSDSGKKIVVYEKHIYYAISDVESTKNDGIYRVDIEGENKEKISGSGSYLNIINDWIYFTNLEDGRSIYKMKIDGSEKTKIANTHSEYLNVSGEWIYYTNMDDNQNLYRMKLDGTGCEKLNDQKSHSLAITEQWIIFGVVINEETWGYDRDATYMMRLDGSEKQLIK